MPTTKYIWDEDNYLAEADATDAINVVYTNEPQQYGNLISTRIASATSYHHFDALGSTRQLTNSAGTVTDTVVYDAWGNVVSRTGTTAVRLCWVGELGYYIDIELTAVYVRSRVYLPSIAVWLSIDPVFGSSEYDAPSFIVPYAYVNGGPLFYVDPSGLARRCPPLQISIPNPTYVPPEPNGCNSAYGDCPNVKGSAGANFKPACDVHDRCYDTCNITKADCDRQFRRQLRAACFLALAFPAGRCPPNSASFSLRRCLAWAQSYFLGVVVGGQLNYNRAQEASCICFPLLCLPLVPSHEQGH